MLPTAREDALSPNGSITYPRALHASRGRCCSPTDVSSHASGPRWARPTDRAQAPLLQPQISPKIPTTKKVARYPTPFQYNENKGTTGRGAADVARRFARSPAALQLPTHAQQTWVLGFMVLIDILLAMVQASTITSKLLPSVLICAVFQSTINRPDTR